MQKSNEYTAPVLLLIFNRPKETEILFDVIRKQKPPKLFVAADGPRFNKENEKELCAKTRNIFNNIDWECDVKTLFRENNLGCQLAIKSAIDWFFEYEESGIILEDDCIPSLSFFPFCSKLLNLYKEEQTVFQISGSSYLNKKNHTVDHYFFSNILSCWGWATWKDRWQSINWEIELSDELKLSLKRRYPSEIFLNWLFHLIQNVIDLKINTWDVQLLCTASLSDKKSIVPVVNLIRNIGEFGEHASFVGLGNMRKVYEIREPNSVKQKIEVNFELDLKQIFFLEKNILFESYIPIGKRIKRHIDFKIGIFKNKILNFFISKLNYFLKFKNFVVVKNDKIIIEDFYKTNSSNKALLSFITKDINSNNYSHSIFKERDTLLEILHKSGYSIDIIDFDSRDLRLELEKYQLVVGFGYAMESATSKSNILKIAYFNGFNLDFSNKINIKKIGELSKNIQYIFLNSSRISNTPYHKTTYFSDYNIILGNDIVKNSFSESNAIQSYKLNAFFTRVMNIDFHFKDFNSARNNFLWFGGTGLSHKGLDWIIELFSELKNVHLHICGPIEFEKDFYNFYRSKLESCTNIHIYNFVDLNSTTFKLLMYKCAFTIMNSISEGGAVSTLNTMANGGLIPVINKNSGLDVYHIGYELYTNDFKEIKKLIVNISNESSSVLLEKSKSIIKEMDNNYSFDNYQSNIRKIFYEILS